MRRYITFTFFLLLLSMQLFSIDDSDSDIVLSAECEPLITIAGCVNVESGRFFQVENDLVANTIDPLHITRFYDSENKTESFIGRGFGSQYAPFLTGVNEISDDSLVMTSMREGFLLPLKGNKKEYRVNRQVFEKGYTNTNGSNISARNNIVNHRARITKQDKTYPSIFNQYELRLGDGTLRKYEKFEFLSKKNAIALGLSTETLVNLITEEIKPNGNKLTFEFLIEDCGEVKPRFSKITTHNRAGEAINFLKFDYSPLDQICVVTSSCGQSVVYTQPLKRFGDELKKKALKTVNSSSFGKTNFTTTFSNHKYRLSKIEKADGSFLEINYNPKHKYVESTYEPLGNNGEVVASYQFLYEKKLTRVTNSMGQVSNYHFDSKKRLKVIDHLVNGQVAKEDRFVWIEKKGQEGWLESKAIQKDDQIYTLQNYEYDARGNPIQKNLYGNITAEKAAHFNYDNRQTSDEYVVNYAYSDDGYNLLTQESYPQGLDITYEYLPSTNLYIKELTLCSKQVKKRAFREYDINGQITELIEDDGSSCDKNDLSSISYRKIKTFYLEPDTTLASFGKPKIIYEDYIDPKSDQKIHLNRKEFTYDNKGYETSCRVYDSKNNFCYETIRIRDGRGRIVQKTNPLMEKELFEYDENDNKTYESVVDSGKETRFFYDQKNRLQRKEEHHAFGEVFVEKYKYDYLGNLIEETDRFGNTFKYSYDRFNNQIQCIKPAIKDELGNLLFPTTHKTYNILNQVESETDENGLTTFYQRNIYGSPTRITYPDGSVERFTYYITGKLKQHWKTDGTSVWYDYHQLGQVGQKSTFDANGILIKSEGWGYKGNLLTIKRDAMGIHTQYEYDGAGRKIKEITENKIDLFAYDDFNRLIKVIHVLDDSNQQNENYQYDWQDRLTSKTLTDANGKIYAKETYAYDINGNRNLKTVWQSDATKAVQQTKFNSNNQLLEKVNPLGECSDYFYNNYKNSIQQSVEKRTQTDPLNRLTIEIDDAHGRVVSKEVYAENQLISSISYAYDPTGKLISETAHVIADGQIFRDYTTKYSYNNRGLVETITEFPNGKSTSYIYDNKGRLLKKIKPDGIVLKYTYDSLDRMIALSSSDGSIHYHYSYDQYDHPIEIKDLVQKTVQNRVYDLYGRLIKEEISQGITINYTYDNLDRLNLLTLPDQSFIKYIYDAFNLIKVERYDNQNNLLYECQCTERDWQARFLKEYCPAGKTTYTYDLLGRTIDIETPFWKSHSEQFDAAGNLLHLKQIDPLGVYDKTFTYDGLNQLTNESGINSFVNDSLGNILSKNNDLFKVNTLNQVESTPETDYTYDLNGNLISQDLPEIIYTYDALNRLTTHLKSGNKTEFIYDAFDRCLFIKTEDACKQLFYLNDHEIGGYSFDKVQETKIADPKSEKVFAIELGDQVYFPLQDFRYNITALRNKDGTLAQWKRYLAYGDNETYGDLALENPWGFSNRREVSGLVQFAHRYYNPSLMRWLTTDPLDFKDGLNLYNYVRNNPFKFHDPDGCFAFVIPLFTIAISATEITVAITTIEAVVSAALIAGTTYVATQISDKLDNNAKMDENEREATKKKGRGANSLKPDPLAEGSHTTIKRDPEGKITNYETYTSQTNPRDPRPWEFEQRYDGANVGPGKINNGHYDRDTQQYIKEPHVHTRGGGLHSASDSEIPK